MPTYEYECAACGHSFDVLQSITDKKLKKCPKCSKLRLHRLIGTGGGIIFKGTGFYETDFKTKDKPKTAKKTGASGSDSKPQKSSAESKSGTKATKSKNKD